ncbi:uncharacterized protein LOC126668246 [Mercurialis annua]|uniref:uncharacterized protein LOC126668246 n=1 Tax=Mercurialis annua TaxID=3986 RepID=UPI00215F1BD0|nr:uncharacterized protein LOC126668246 [Mercurialis annua]
MNHLFWNCRGLGNPRTVRYLRCLVQRYSPSLVFLSETKLVKAKIDCIFQTFGYDTVVVDSVGNGGGLVVGWKEGVSANLRSMSANHIDLDVKLSRGDDVWRFTGFYGFPSETDKFKSWDLLAKLGSESHGAWLIGGDFNEILWQKERVGGRHREERKMQAFREVLANCNLRDLGFKGSQFTWSRGNGDRELIFERLDRIVGNGEWSTLFPNYYALTLLRKNSDHAPILLESSNRRAVHRRRKKVARFESMWIRRDDCENVIKASWNTTNGALLPMCDRTSSYMNDLQVWNKDVVGNLSEKIQRKRKQLLGLQQNAANRSQYQQIRCVEGELDELLRCEETLWMQRSKALWLKDGDKNTAYFHQKASQRKRRNHIDGLFNSDGIWCEGENEINGAATAYFQQLFTSSNPTNMGGALAGISKTLSTDSIHLLSSQYTREEVVRAINQMHSHKAPGPDGDYKQAAKCSSRDYFPNSKRFCKGRLISDNILVAFESFHKGKKGYMAMKLDMSKAYDRVEWCFLETVKNKMGFPTQVVSLIMKCITSVSFSIMINRVPQSKFSPHRGLRQGDPLSPFLFIMCAEAFLGLFTNAVSEGKIHGIRIARSAPVVSHLFFADDSIIFARASEKEAKEIQSIIKCYEDASGQVINFNKTAISFSRNISMRAKRGISNLLRVRSVVHHDRYLGLPTFVGRSKREIFNIFLERVWKKLSSWKEKTLSKAAKEVLLKSVIQAIPTYTMSVFKMPLNICSEFQSLMAKFWWKNGSSERGMHWVGWEKLCRSKSSGGLGFQNIAAFNSAMLAKQGWRLLHEENSLVAQVLKARYYPRHSFLEAKLKPGASYTWRSIHGAIPLLKRGVRWKREGLFYANPKNADVNMEMTVSELFNLHGHGWNVQMVEESCCPVDAEFIKNYTAGNQQPGTN